MSPLAYCRRAYVQFGLFERAMAAHASTMRVGAILDYNGSILLLKERDGVMLLPVGSGLGPTEDKDSLKGVLHTHGVDAGLEFLFSVFEDTRRHDNTIVHIFCRGTLRKPPPQGGAAMLVPFDAVPYQAVQGAFAGMLSRFVGERAANAAAVYCGDLHSGVLQPLSGFPRIWSAIDQR